MPDLFIARTKKTAPPQPAELSGDPAALKPPASTAQPEREPASPPSFFCAYALSPTGISFENQEPGETVLLFVRRHLITNLKWISLSTILLLIPVLLFLLTPFLFTSSFFSIPGPFLLVLILFYYLIVSGFMFINFVSWFYNVGIITNRRIVDIDFTDLSYKHVSAARMGDVEESSFVQKGFLQTALDFGDVHVQTESQASNIEFLSVPHPAKITDLISSTSERFPNG